MELRSLRWTRLVVGVMAMLALVPWLGLYGAALGSLIGTAAVSLPLNLSALARQESRGGPAPIARSLAMLAIFVPRRLLRFPAGSPPGFTRT